MCAAAGLPDDLHFHRLRHTRLTELAEGGASEAEIRATGGHKTASMVARDTRKADQKRLAEAADARLQPAVVRLRKRKRNANSV
jgi:integrase